MNANAARGSNTREKFLEKRLEFVEREWRRLDASNSLECRNCRSPDSMDLTRQSPCSAQAHERFLINGEMTCIDCHKGIAHQLPDFGNVSLGGLSAILGGGHGAGPGNGD